MHPPYAALRAAPWIAVTLLVAAACAGSGPGGNAATPAPSATADAPVLVRSPWPEPPETIGEWTVALRHDDDLDIGPQSRYARLDGLSADGWVYPVVWPEAACRLECLEEWVMAETDEFRDLAPPQLLELGYFSSMELLSDDTLPPPAPGLTQARHLAYHVIDESGKEGRSDFLLAAGHGYRVKVRLTDYSGLADDMAARDLFEGYAAGMAWPYECLIGEPPDIEAIHMESTTDVPVDRVAEIIESVLTGSGYDLKSRAGAFTTVATFDWPEGTDAEAWHGEASPGYQLLVMLEQRADSTAYAVESHVVCDAGEPLAADSGSPISTLRMVAAVMFTSELTKALEAEGR